MASLLELHVLIPLLVFVAIMALGGAVLIFRGARHRVVHDRLFGRQSDAAVAPMGQGSDRWLEQTLERVGRPMATGESAGVLRRKLLQAGYYHESAPAVFLGSQLALAAGAILLAAVVVMQINLPVVMRLLLALSLIAAAALLPNLVVGLRQRRRSREVTQNLPDAVDLLEICVTAGMGLDMAWNAVTDHIRGVSPLLADEMALTNLEIQLGAGRETAMRNMAGRTGASDLNSLVAVLVQSDRFGISIGQTLRSYAASLRAERSQRAEEAGEKLAVKLLFPMVLFIFPVLFVVILGPALIQIGQVFGDL
ncbi:MAG: type II secretion system F family protein [Phycisphaeraceae bacterium]